MLFSAWSFRPFRVRDSRSWSWGKGMVRSTFRHSWRLEPEGNLTLQTCSMKLCWITTPGSSSPSKPQHNQMEPPSCEARVTYDWFRVWGILKYAYNKEPWRIITVSSPKPIHQLFTLRFRPKRWNCFRRRRPGKGVSKAHLVHDFFVFAWGRLLLSLLLALRVYYFLILTPFVWLELCLVHLGIV